MWKFLLSRPSVKQCEMFSVSVVKAQQTNIYIVYLSCVLGITNPCTYQLDFVVATFNPKENWIQGGGNRVFVNFAVTFLDCWRTSVCVTTIIKIVHNNTNDKLTFGASLALDEDSPYTNSCLFSLDRLPLLLLLRKN